MEGRRIKIGAVGPDQGTGFEIKPHLIEQRKLTQWAEDLAREHGAEIYPLLAAIVKAHLKRVLRNNPKGDNLIDWMKHFAIPQLSGAMGWGKRPLCKRSQSASNSP
jgi:hypothetical protein